MQGSIMQYGCIPRIVSDDHIRDSTSSDPGQGPLSVYQHADKDVTLPNSQARQSHAYGCFQNMMKRSQLKDDTYSTFDLPYVSKRQHSLSHANICLCR